MSSTFIFHPQLILRTPLFPARFSAEADDITRFFQKDAAAEALYLASPGLSRELHKQHTAGTLPSSGEEKIIRSLTKYYYRMHHRPTPFGLFAGLSMLDWSENASGIRIDTDTIQRHTRLDMACLCGIAQQIEKIPEARLQLRYYPNSSLYTLHDEFRYVEFLYKADGSRIHQISAVNTAAHLEQIFEYTRQGIKLIDIADALVDEDISQEQAIAFVEELVAAQLLVSELEPSVTGLEYAHQLATCLERLSQSVPHPLVQNIKTQLDQLLLQIQQLDQNQINPVSAYTGILQQVKNINEQSRENQLLQVDFMRPTVPGFQALDQQRQQQIRKAVEILAKLAPDNSNRRLDRFKEKFVERYEGEEMPLLTAVDSENGIGYGDSGISDDNVLTKDLLLPSSGQSTEEIKWNAVSRWKAARLIQATEQNQREVVLQDSDLKDFPDQTDSLPPSLSCIFRLVGENRMFIESLGNPSATNLLGRFAHLSPELEQLVHDICTEEQKHNPEVAFAEIAHLPESRLGNIIQRPVLRDYEIPYLAKSAQPKEKQIPLQDLSISVIWNRIVLRSQRLQKEIIPRLSTAHNFTFNAQPVYQLLCDLQLQGNLNYLHFDWGPLSRYHTFLPRLRYQDIVLFPATWQLTEKDIKKILRHQDPLACGQWLRDTYHLPEQFVLADGDNELLVNTEDALSMQTWLGAIKQRTSIRLKESMPDQLDQVQDQHGEATFANQFVATLIKQKATYPDSLPPMLEKKTISKHTEQKFFPNSNWVYYKIYTGVKSADRILVEAVKPLTDRLLQQGLIDKWFFLRFTDPDPHLRLRLLARSEEQQADIHFFCQQYLLSYQESGLVWKTQTDTYIRELNRYGRNTIELCESVFYHDSTATLQFLTAIQGNEYSKLRWLWGLKSIDTFLDSVQYDLRQKMELIQVLKDAFAQEFHVDKAFRKQLSKKLRTFSADIDQIMQEQLHAQLAIYQSLAERQQPLQTLGDKLLHLHEKDQLMVKLENILMSHIHMIINRLIPSLQRKHEVVLYDFLYQHYRSQAARHKQQQRLQQRKVG